MKTLPGCFALLACAGAFAQTVTLQGMLGGKALLIVDGTAPKSVAPGEMHQGVRVLSTSGDQAVIDIAGKRHTLRVGDAPASVGESGGNARGSRIVLTAGSRRATFLPQVWDDLPEPEQFFEQLRRKAGLAADHPLEHCTVARYSVRKWTERELGMDA